MTNYKVIIYGMGRMSKTAVSSLKNCEVVAYVDSYSKVGKHNNIPIIDINDILKIKFDYLIITIFDKDISCEIYEKLVNDIGIKPTKIIKYNKIINSFYYMKVDRVLSNSEEVKGIVLGISHAAYGFNTNDLEKYVNLAVRSQDIYYNIKTLKYFLKRKNCNPEVIVFDLYDYNYLNYDVSLIRDAIKIYYSQRGFIKEEHNFSNNKFYNGRNLNECLKEIGIEKYQETNIISKMFDMSKINVCDSEYKGYGEEYKKELDISKISNTMMKKFLEVSTVVHRHESTIEENKQLLLQLCKYINEEFPNTQLWFIFIPRYKDLEMQMTEVMKPWKREIYTYLRQLKEYGIRLLDLKNCESISAKSSLYNDIAHLNHVGGRKLAQYFEYCQKNNIEIWNDEDC